MSSDYANWIATEFDKYGNEYRIAYFFFSGEWSQPLLHGQFP